MADLSDKDSSMPVKISGADASGTETNFVGASTTGILTDTKLRGDTDGTLIGNDGDALNVNVTNGVGASGIVNDGSLFGIADVINAVTAGVDNPLLLIKNPSGSGKDFYFWRARLASLITNNSMLFKIFINPTVTADGTTIVPVNRNVGGTNPATVIQAFTLPTISALGTLVTVAGVGQNNNSIDLNEDFAIRLAPNQTILITGSPSSNNRTAGVTIVWQELAP